MNKIFLPIIAAIGALSLLLLYISGVGYQSGTFELGQAFRIMEIAATGGITGAGLTVLYILWQRPMGIGLLVLFLAALMGLTAFYLPYRQQQIAARVPVIHDISTDLEDPPQFTAIAAQRNPVETPGCPPVDVPAAQREFYPDIMSRVYVQNPTEVFTAVLAVAEDLGWEVVAADQATGRVEATDTTRWFGFKDDVVVRLSPGSSGSTVIDVRSVSRVGCSDIGVNANRIRAFTAAINERLQVNSQVP